MHHMKNTSAENHHEHTVGTTDDTDTTQHFQPIHEPKKKVPKYRSHLNAARGPVALATKRARGRITHPGKRGRA